MPPPTEHLEIIRCSPLRMWFINFPRRGNLVARIKDEHLSTTLLHALRASTSQDVPLPERCVAISTVRGLDRQWETTCDAKIVVTTDRRDTIQVESVFPKGRPDQRHSVRMCRDIVGQLASNVRHIARTLPNENFFFYAQTLSDLETGSSDDMRHHEGGTQTPDDTPAPTKCATKTPADDAKSNKQRRIDPCVEDPRIQRMRDTLAQTREDGVPWEESGALGPHRVFRKRKVSKAVTST